MDYSYIDTNRLIEMYESGKSTNDIAEIIGVSGGFVCNRLKSAGIVLTGNRKTVDDDAIVDFYVAGNSENATAKKFGVSRNLVRKRLVESGVHVRSQSESESLKWSKMSADERAKQVDAANKAIRNMPKSFHTQQAIKQAKTKEQTLSKVGSLEKEFIQEFTNRGFSPIPQKAVHVYNIDIAIASTAIEIHINAHHPHSRDRKRIVDLLKRGWDVIYIKITNDVSVERATDKVCRMIDLIESDKSGVCHYGMIRGTSELVASGCLDGNNLTVVDASNGFFAAIE